MLEQATVSQETGSAAPAAAPSEPAVQEVRIVDEREQRERDKAAHDNALKDIIRKSKEAKAEPEPAAKGPERGEDGKFKTTAKLDEKIKSGEAVDKPEAKAPEKAAEKPVEATKELVKPEPKKAKAEAPGHWPETVRNRFAELPDDMQEALAEAGLKDRQALTKLGQHAKALEPVVKVFDEFKDTIAHHGTPPHEAVRQLLGAQKALDADPVAGLAEIAKAYKLDNPQALNKFARQLGINPDDAFLSSLDEPASNPALEQLQQTNQALQQRLASLEQQLQSRAHQEQEAKVGQNLSVVEKFAAENPEFESVKDEMMVLIPRLRDENPHLSAPDLLQKALEMAVWANPTTRQKRLEAETQKRQQEALEAANQARQAGSINVTSSPGDFTPTNHREALRAVLRKNRAA